MLSRDERVPEGEDTPAAMDLEDPGERRVAPGRSCIVPPACEFRKAVGLADQPPAHLHDLRCNDVPDVLAGKPAKIAVEIKKVVDVDRVEDVAAAEEMALEGARR